MDGHRKLCIEDVSKVFTRNDEKIQAVYEVSMNINPNEFIVLVGPSGCGKSTLLHMVAGLIKPTSGRILLDGKEVTGPGPDRSVVFQQSALYPWLTISGNVEFGLSEKGLGKGERKQIVKKYIAMMGLEGFEKAYPHELSGGMRHRVSIARSYAVNPDILLMDEPFAALDAQLRMVMQEELLRLWVNEKHTIIFVTHSVEEAIYLGDKVVLMSRRPGTIKRIIDITGDKLLTEERRIKKVNEVMTSEKSFTTLRAQLWDMLRQEMDE